MGMENIMKFFEDIASTLPDNKSRARLYQNLEIVYRKANLEGFEEATNDSNPKENILSHFVSKREEYSR